MEWVIGDKLIPKPPAPALISYDSNRMKGLCKSESGKETHGVVGGLQKCTPFLPFLCNRAIYKMTLQLLPSLGGACVCSP